MLSVRPLLRSVAGRSPLLLTAFKNQRYFAQQVKGSINQYAPPIETNKATETNRLEKTLTKFWEKVSAEENNESFHIKLDSKIIKTPLGYDLVIPKEKKTLAYLLVHEWRSLPNLQIKPHLVPLTSLVSRSIDLRNSSNSNDKELLAKIGGTDLIKTQLLRYLDTDTLLVFSPVKDCDGILREKQEELYRPIIKSMEEHFTQFASAPVKLTYMDSDLHGMIGNKQFEETQKAVLNYLDSLDIWSLVALEKATLTAKSFLTGVSLLRMCDHKDTYNVSLDDIATAATLETVVQTSIWGEVEDTHDVDKVDIRRNLAAASIVAFRG